jgi:hypothetical protein
METTKNMENLELRRTLAANWAVANLMRSNLEQLVPKEDRINPPSGYACWSIIGHVLLNPGSTEDRQCQLYALWQMAQLFCDLLDEVKDETPKWKGTVRLSKGR